MAPWVVGKRQGGKFPIIKKTTGEVVGHSTSKKKAQSAIRARYAAEGGAKMRG